MIKPDDWRPVDDLNLEPNALKAVKEQSKCTAITAGPGAGKTEMLAQRADFLLQTGLCRFPKRILAISFKVDASRNLKDRVRLRCRSYLSARFDSHTFHAFAKRIIDRFRPVLTGINALDVNYTIGEPRVTRRQISFIDLVPLASQILQSSTIARRTIRQTYSHVFLDEFQDCTKHQYLLIKLAFQETDIKLTAVGDTKQKIMGWAGALEGIFVNFAEDFKATPLNLYRNFRSQPKLLRMQNEIIKVMDPNSATPEELIDGNDGLIEVQQYINSQKEAEYLTNQIHNWLSNEKLPHSEIAVLISKNVEHYAELLMNELNRRGIPFRNEQQLQDVSTEPVVRLIIDYLLVLYGSREPKAYERLMARLTDSSLDEEEQIIIQGKWRRFLESEQKKAAQADLINNNFSTRWNFATNFLKMIGRTQLVALSSDYENTSRLNEVIKETDRRLIELLNADSNLLGALSRFYDDSAIRIMTIHKSKGLEFDSVIILGVENEAFWGDPDEERCAFFVGISRAKRRLIVTTSDRRSTPAGNPDRWQELRTPHEEFLSYAKPFL